MWSDPRSILKRVLGFALDSAVKSKRKTGVNEDSKALGATNGTQVPPTETVRTGGKQAWGEA